MIAPTPKVEADGFSLLKPAEAASVKAGFGFTLSCDHAVLEAFDQRNPDKTKALDAILLVDQKAFAVAINGRSPQSSPVITVEKIECYFWEMRDLGYVTPIFRVKWTVRYATDQASTSVEASSFGIRYNGRVWDNAEVRPLWIRGASSGYQAATYKLAIALQKLLEKEHRR